MSAERLDCGICTAELEGHDLVQALLCGHVLHEACKPKQNNKQNNNNKKQGVHRVLLPDSWSHGGDDAVPHLPYDLK